MLQSRSRARLLDSKAVGMELTAPPFPVGVISGRHPRRQGLAASVGRGRRRAPDECEPGKKRRAFGVTVVARAMADAVRACKRLLWTWNARVNDRMFLRSLQDCELHEMGLTLDDRCREVNKPFWRG